MSEIGRIYMFILESVLGIIYTDVYIYTHVYINDQSVNGPWKAMVRTVFRIYIQFD